jgi:eukaryotic-like serine/threonine-protein kinase
MSLIAGTKLGPYEILSPLGAGGMGEVYRARDTRLERTVAIKVLPSHLSSSPESRQRFEREAKTISQLSHPHICALYDVGREGDTEYLVMEYLEGETLSERLMKGALPLEQTLRHGIEIADALDKAHRQGIVHRDLKPGNVMLTKSGVKLLDFGLAKAFERPLDAAGREQAAAGQHPMARNAFTSIPTVVRSPDLTQEGTILGTLQYMSPEQLEGKEADGRTDIFALGAVLYEMATGRKAFSGTSQASLISSIMTADPPPITAIQPMTPPALDRVVVKTCLAKDPEDRWQSAGDVAKELRWISEGSAAGLAAPEVVSSRRRVRERLAWAAAAVAAAAATWFAVGGSRRRVEPRPAIQASILPSRGSEFSFARSGAGSLTLSPDGKFLTFEAAGADGVLKLWLRPLEGGDARPIPGTEDGQFPFWSADSRFIGFFARSKLKKIAVSGGAAIEICDVSGDPRGGTWNRDGVILFEPHWREGLYRVSADGGVPQIVTRVDEKRKETTHRFPFFLPDGRHYLYLAGSHVAEDTSGENAIYLGELGSTDRRLLVHTRSNAVYASGHLIYVSGRSLVAQRFDPRRLTLDREVATLTDEVHYERGFFQGVFSASETGLLAYQRRGAETLKQVRWFDRAGKPGESLTKGDVYLVRLSPDGKTAAVSGGDPGDIWLYDLERGIRSRLTFDPLNEMGPVWSPDGKTIYYSSDRNILLRIYRRKVSGAGQEETLTSPSEWAMAWDVSPDSRFLVYEQSTSTALTNVDLWILPLSGGGKPTPFLATPFSESEASFSPDGRWLAYTSNESGRFEVYVTSLPGREGRWQISSGGGSGPRWRRDGRELFYVAPDRRIHSVEVRAGGAFDAGAPRPLFATQMLLEPTGCYDVTADGQRFLVCEPVEAETPEPITIVVGWPAALKGR